MRLRKHQIQCLVTPIWCKVGLQLHQSGVNSGLGSKCSTELWKVWATVLPPGAEWEHWPLQKLGYTEDSEVTPKM